MTGEALALCAHTGIMSPRCLHTNHIAVRPLAHRSHHFPLTIEHLDREQCEMIIFCVHTTTNVNEMLGMLVVVATTKVASPGFAL